MLRKNILVLVLGMLCLSVLACNTLLGAPSTPTREPQPTEPPLPTKLLEPTLAPTSGALRLGQTVMLTSEVISETNASPLYTLHVETPVLQGQADPRVT